MPLVLGLPPQTIIRTFYNQPHRQRELRRASHGKQRPYRGRQRWPQESQPCCATSDPPPAKPLRKERRLEDENTGNELETGEKHEGDLKDAPVQNDAEQRCCLHLVRAERAGQL